ncbi:5-formyltetrahydrofolate cyclo-ligase [Rhizobium sp. BK377]|uniref:5-formyltetrahydrofolate cyclo-ligase n=1 Tax=Rhizobium sp. BK377 TaxID=2587058 RepID=UPI0016136775|nr:5-formyltetrahydrofolate cyclo-ligase [Rhizobium sp. BK377]MBB3461694.1 5,10-methenyltetrahydrofolate synthetase [Rhizobium sp. BK377]
MQKDQPDDYASPACLMHEVDPAYMGLEESWDVVREWRRAERKRLIDARKLIDSAERERKTALISSHLDRLLAPVIAGKCVSVYWPFQGEPDLRGWMTAIAERATCLLPVVAEKAKPLTFRTWTPGARLERSVLGILIPTEGEERQPDIVIAPVVGYDRGCYRLGVGGGYFDRTLAALSPKPLAIGIGFSQQQIRTIKPQPHDIPMDAVITEDGAIRRSAAPFV